MRPDILCTFVLAKEISCCSSANLKKTMATWKYRHMQVSNDNGIVNQIQKLPFTQYKPPLELKPSSIYFCQTCLIFNKAATYRLDTSNFVWQVIKVYLLQIFRTFEKHYLAEAMRKSFCRGDHF